MLRWRTRNLQVPHDHPPPLDILQHRLQRLVCHALHSTGTAQADWTPLTWPEMSSEKRSPGDSDSRMWVTPSWRALTCAVQYSSLSALGLFGNFRKLTLFWPASFSLSSQLPSGSLSSSSTAYTQQHTALYRHYYLSAGQFRDVPRV